MALLSAAAAGGGGRLFLPFFTVPTHRVTNSPHGRRRRQVENGLSAGDLAEPQGDELSAGLLNGLCCMDRGAADLIFTPLWFRAKSSKSHKEFRALPCPVLYLGQFFFPLGVVPCCLSDPLHGCWPPH